MRIVLTHSPGRFEGLAEALVRRGHAVAHRPLIVTRPRKGDAVRQEAEALLALPWLLFTSRSAVEAFTGLGLPWRGADGTAPRVGAVGRKTASALERAGMDPALVAERSPNAAGLADAFLADPRAAGPVGLPQGDRALPTLRRALEQAGFETRPLVLYETVPQPSIAVTEGAQDPLDEAELVVLASPSAAGALPVEIAARAVLVAIGPTTAATLGRRGLACRQATTPSVGSVVEAVEDATAEAPTGASMGRRPAAAHGVVADRDGGREDEGGRE